MTTDSFLIQKWVTLKVEIFKYLILYVAISLCHEILETENILKIYFRFLFLAITERGGIYILKAFMQVYRAYEIYIFLKASWFLKAVF